MVSNQQIRVAVLVLVDALILLAAFAAAFQIRFQTGITLSELEITPVADMYVRISSILVVLWLLLFVLFGVYGSSSPEYAKIGAACATATVAVIGFQFVWPSLVIARGWLLASFLLTFLFTAAGHFVISQIGWR